MNLRMLLNIPTKKHSALIDADVVILMEKFRKLACLENRDQKEARECHDETCPKCQATKEKIVDKISNVFGTGIIKREQIMFNNTNNTILIDTLAVNHCTNCGHEWKKYKTKTIHASNIAGTALNYLYQYLDGNLSSRREFKEEVLELFNNVSAEAIMKVYDNNKQYCHNNTRIRRLTILKYFKSVYDTQPRDLKELF